MSIKRKTKGNGFLIHNRYSNLKFFVCCMSLYLSILMAACSKDDKSGNDNTSDENNVSYATQEREWVYVPEVITVGDERADYGRMQLVGDTFCYVLQGGDTESSAKSICRYSLTSQELTGVAIDWLEGGKNWDVGVRFFAQDYSLYMTANVYPADYSSMKRFLCRFDSEGNCLFSKDIMEQLGRGASLDGLTVDGQGRIYIFTDNGEILLYTGAGEYHGSISYRSSESLTSAQIKGTCDGVDGKYYVCIAKGSVDIAGNTDGADFRCTLMEIDFEGARLLEVAGDIPAINGLCAGKQRGGDSAGESDNSGRQYDLLLYDDRAVYGYDLATQKSNLGSAGEELLIWLDSDINGYCVTNLYLLEDGRLCATVEDWKNEDRAIVVLTGTKAEEAPWRENLVLATVDGESDLAAMAVKFNRGSSRYHLTIKGYASLTDLYNAVLAKETVDLVDLSGINVQELATQGFFEDLTPYVSQSEMLDRSDFVDGILDVYTFDNTLVSIPAAFTLQTVVGNGAQLQNKAGLTLEELLTAAGCYPEAQTFDGVTKKEMMQYLMMFNEDTFIDWEVGVCHFDSEGFKTVLEYVNRFPDCLESGRVQVSLPTKIHDGEVLFAIANMNRLNAFQEYAGMFGEDAVCVGFPTADGRGGHLLITGDAYAISAASEHREGAWKFIEGFLAQEKSEDYYRSPHNYFGGSFPTLKKTLNEKVENSIEEGSQIPGDQFPTRIYSDGATFQYHVLTWDEVNVILDLVPDATPFFSVEDNEIIKIINEEAYGYYSGQKRVEDVTGIIQNRVQLYVNENI